MDIHLQGKRVRLDPSASIGKGGEGDVFDIGGGLALKVWKAPDHPDYAGLTADQEAARDRIEAHQQKLRAFPKNLPARVVAPALLATDRSGKRVVGYTMPLVAGAEVLLRYGEPSVRRGGLGGGEVTRVLSDLHRSVGELHRAGVVIGDFNDLNVLVKDGEAHLIDVDSFQFGAFLCKVFTERFVDPLLCDPAGDRPVLARPFGERSDWYSFAVMVMQSLLCVGPYGGIFRPASKSDRIAQHARWQKRITVLHPEVQYPKPAIPYGVLPDDLLQALHRIFERDERGPFPGGLLDELAWTRCPTCGAEHARAVCPDCKASPPAAIKEVTTVRGQVTSTRILETHGVVLCACIEDGEIRYLVHEDGEARREDGSVALRGDVDPFMRFAIQGRSTLVGRGGQVVVLSPGAAPERFSVDCFQGRPSFAANARHRYFVRGGRLLRRAAQAQQNILALADDASREHVGDVLAGQTLFWVDDTFGFGFYRAGNLSVAFVFDAARRGLDDTVKLPFLGGRLVDAFATLADRRAWVLLAAEHGGRTVHQCIVVNARGAVEATAQGEAGDGTWLGSLRGKCAVGKFLLSATDTGVVRVEARDGVLVETRRFPDTEPFVNASSELLAGKDGLYVIEPRVIRRLRIA